MKITGIIAEYNPFHSGHQHHINEVRRQGATHIVAVMSGSFVQRGDVAVLSKWARAEAALCGGIDLVVELPVPYALASADRFGLAGVSLLNQLSVDSISFGSECGQLALLQQTAEFARSAEQSSVMTDCLSKGMSYPRAREQAVTTLYGAEYGGVLASPNNLLGIAYLNAIRSVNDRIRPMTIPRAQVAHDAAVPAQGMASASFLRELLAQGRYEALRPYLPTAAVEIYQREIDAGRAPILSARLETLALYRLRTMKAEEYALLPDVSEGLENRLYRAGRNAVSLSEFYETVKTKRYTLARIRRIVWCALLGITAREQTVLPAYVRVLGTNQRGMEIIAHAQKTASIPILPKFATLYRKNPAGIALTVAATDLAGFAAPVIQPGGADFVTNTIIVKPL